MSRKVGVLTTGRADFGICLPIANAINADPSLELYLIVSGTHLSPEFGASEFDILDHKLSIDERIEMLVSSDSSEGISKSMGLAMIGFAQSFSCTAPDILLVIGDRFEVHAAVAATIPFGIPVAHVHGGEITAGAIDDFFRHSITKMSHIHFATTVRYADRIAQMGEEQWRITVSGAPGLDNFLRDDIPGQDELARAFDLDFMEDTLLVTYHPVTVGGKEEQLHDIKTLLGALEVIDAQVIFTYPNADTGGRSIVTEVEAFCRQNSKARLVINATQSRYIGLLNCVDGMVGNSSSGIIEAASFQLPVINIGSRQDGRIRASNVIDVPNDRSSIEEGIKRGLSSSFRGKLEGLNNPYGDGRASQRIVDVLKKIELGDRLLKKKFCDIKVG